MIDDRGKVAADSTKVRAPAGLLLVPALASGLVLRSMSPLVGQASGAARVTAADYSRAERMLPGRADTLVYRVETGGYRAAAGLEPRWIGGGPAFWYRVQVPGGFEFMYADPSRKELRPAFDHARLATALSSASDTTYVARRLPFTDIQLDAAGTVRFAASKAGWRCDLKVYACARDERAAPALPGEARSPDGRWSVFRREHDLWVRERATEVERQLTTDGEKRYGWAPVPGVSTVAVTMALSGRWAPPVTWAPDSNRFLTYRLDERRVQDLHLLQSVHSDGKRPRLWSYPYAMPGDSIIPLAELAVFDPSNGTRVAIKTDPLHVLWTDPVSQGHVWWSDDGRTVYFLEWERGRRAYRLKAADAATGESRTLLEERGKTLVEPFPWITGRPNIRVIAGGREIIWYSERDGWAHLYRFDANTGQLRNRITSGEFVVHEILHVDEKVGRVFFTARGREAGRDLYHGHVYSVGIDGSGMRLLTPEDGDHDVSVSPDGRFLVGSYSTVDRAPVAVARSADGQPVLPLEKADISQLTATGWRPPDRFQVKAADGTTDIYGVIYLPSNLDPARRYPVLDDIYPGPQVIQAPIGFQAGSDAQALAELGFVVVKIDGRGTPHRSKSFHDYSYGNLQSGGALDDHVAGLKQLAKERPYMDLERVGVYGFSGGGFASARAILMYPDFYDVAVSAAGNHDQRGYVAFWGETYQGLPQGDSYAAQANPSLAKNLKGKLLLAYGDMDDNVHYGLTIQLIDELIKANKKYDLLIMPNRNHGFGTDPYFIARRWDYFVEHLLGQEPPEYAIRPLPRS